MKDITRIFVETTIRKAIRDIKDSPKRSFRNLIDLGLNFAKGRFEKPFLVSVQNLLQNEQSPYYDLVLDTVHNVDTDRLITFGMNVGYNGCTKGAKIIREIESKENYNIPWSLSLEIDGENYLDNEDMYFKVINDGKDLGIFTYFIFAKELIKPTLSLAKKFEDCAFVYFCEEEFIDNGLLDEAEDLYNLMLAVKYNEDMANTLLGIRERNMLYSVYIPYSEDNADEVISDDFYMGVEELHPVFTVLLPLQSTSKECCEKVYEYVKGVRNEQRMATILWDVYSDGKFVDNIISESECSVAFDQNGSPIPFDNVVINKEMNIFSNQLCEILKSLPADI